MNTRTPLIIGLFGLIVVAGLAYYYAPQNAALPNDGTATTTPSGYDQSISDGIVTVHYSLQDWGLATNASQVLVAAYIPPCSPEFNYCLYYKGQAYAATNLESAGIAITKRTDLTSERLCLQTPPDGFDAGVAPAATKTEDLYASSAFLTSDAAAGHYAQGTAYRLYVRSSGTCYQVETRIGETQFANYPAGTKVEFTAADRTALKAKLTDLAANITLGGQKDLFPAL